MGFIMGLFGKKKVQEEPVQQQKPEFRTEWENVSTNLTDRMLRVELEGNKAYARNVYISQVDDRIRLVSDGIILAEVTKRGKAYKELEPQIGFTADYMNIEAKTGDYGEYYRITLKFKNTIVTS